MSYHHIFWKQNGIDDSLSKKGLLLPNGVFQVITHEGSTKKHDTWLVGGSDHGMVTILYFVFFFMYQVLNRMIY